MIEQSQYFGNLLCDITHLKGIYFLLQRNKKSLSSAHGIAGETANHTDHVSLIALTYMYHQILPHSEWVPE